MYKEYAIAVLVLVIYGLAFSVSDEDEDVSKEAAAVQQSSQDFILKIQDVTKSFLSG